jgi:alkylated DNA repair dioxygenase AlkB
MNSRLYPLGSSLEAHLDSHEAWVLLLSLGCSATFLLRPRGCDAKRVEMASGDAIIFHGGARWQVEHAVERIVPDTCPEHLAALLARGRIGLQLRGAEDTGDARAWTREAGPRETSLY